MEIFECNVRLIIPAPRRIRAEFSDWQKVIDYARDGIRSWTDVVAAAEIVRSMLGVSPSAWAEARAAMGEIEAAITLSAIFERAEAIRSPGGYLRDLTRKAELGRFSVRPMLKALE
mgnify:CR=1 FL=1